MQREKFAGFYLKISNYILIVIAAQKKSFFSTTCYLLVQIFNLLLFDG